MQSGSSNIATGSADVIAPPADARRFYGTASGAKAIGVLQRLRHFENTPAAMADTSGVRKRHARLLRMVAPALLCQVSPSSSNLCGT